MTADDAVKRSTVGVAVRSDKNRFMLYKATENSVAVADGTLPIPIHKLKFTYMEDATRLLYNDWYPMKPIIEGMNRKKLPNND